MHAGGVLRCRLFQPCDVQRANLGLLVKDEGSGHHCIVYDVTDVECSFTGINTSAPYRRRQYVGSDFQAPGNWTDGSFGNAKKKQIHTMLTCLGGGISFEVTLGKGVLSVIPWHHVWSPYRGILSSQTTTQKGKNENLEEVRFRLEANVCIVSEVVR